MDIRRAVPADTDRIMEIVAAVVPRMRAVGNPQWSEVYPLRCDFETDLADGTLYVCELDGTVVGTVGLNGRQSPEYVGPNWRKNADCLCIHRMAVDPERQGQGIARALMDYAVELAMAGPKYIRTDTNVKNAAMNGLLLSFGFVPVGIIHFRGIADPFTCYDWIG